MEYLFEFILELLFESAVSATKSEKVPKPLRLLLGLLLSLLVLGLVGGVLVLAVYLLVKKRSTLEISLGVVLSVIDGLMIFSAVKKARGQIRKKKNAEEITACQEDKGEEDDCL